MNADSIAVLLASAAAFSALTLVLALYTQSKLQKKRRQHHSTSKSGRPRKQRIPNRDRQRSLSNRGKLQALPEQDFAAGCRMTRSVFEQLLALVEPVLANQTHRKRKLPKNYEQYDRFVDPYVACLYIGGRPAGLEDRSEPRERLLESFSDETKQESANSVEVGEGDREVIFDL